MNNNTQLSVDWEQVFENAQTMHLQEFINYYAATPSTVTGDAVEFADWVVKCDFRKGAGNKYWFEWSGFDVLETPYTTLELYELFQKYKQSYAQTVTTK